MQNTRQHADKEFQAPMPSVRLLGISGSPRKGSNTDILVQQVLAAAGESGAATEFIKGNSHAETQTHSGPVAL